MKALLLAAPLALVTAEPKVDMQRFDAAIAAEAVNAPRSPSEWRRLEKAVAINESGLLQRIADGHCLKHECDHGRAKGLFQIHRNTLNRDSWAKQDGDIELQAHLASEQLKRAFWQCHKSGVPWLEGTLSAYAGLPCRAKWKGLDARVATYRVLR